MQTAHYATLKKALKINTFQLVCSGYYIRAAPQLVCKQVKEKETVNVTRLSIVDDAKIQPDRRSICRKVFFYQKALNQRFNAF